jgi:hypothetical protein
VTNFPGSLIFFDNLQELMHQRKHRILRRQIWHFYRDLSSSAHTASRSAFDNFRYNVLFDCRNFATLKIIFISVNPPAIHTSYYYHNTLKIQVWRYAKKNERHRSEFDEIIEYKDTDAIAKWPAYGIPISLGLRNKKNETEDVNE